MSFQMLNFGPVSASLQEYADLDGLVPELGDDWHSFHWCRRTTDLFTNQEVGEQCWHDFLVKAIATTQQAAIALQALQEWRQRRSHF